ncbi:hypothetical protein NL676_029725 [Syzygium grande]|nr:hypothetical protein NL676_029725 [Syzygium grande]
MTGSVLVVILTQRLLVTPPSASLHTTVAGLVLKRGEIPGRRGAEARSSNMRNLGASEMNSFISTAVAWAKISHPRSRGRGRMESPRKEARRRAARHGPRHRLS